MTSYVDGPNLTHFHFASGYIKDMARPARSLNSSCALGSDRFPGNRFPELGSGLWGKVLNMGRGPLCGSCTLTSWTDLVRRLEYPRGPEFDWRPHLALKGSGGGGGVCFLQNPRVPI